jgi:hypothetical protein
LIQKIPSNKPTVFSIVGIKNILDYKFNTFVSFFLQRVSVYILLMLTETEETDVLHVFYASKLTILKIDIPPDYKMSY